MKIDANALINILEQQRDAYKQLIELAQQGQKFIVRGDSDGLSETVTAIERRLATVRELESARQSLIHPHAATGSPRHIPILSQLIKEFEPDAAQRAEALRVNILDLLTEFSEINRVNNELVKRNLNYVDFMLNLFIPDENPMYGEKPVTQPAHARIFDGRA